MTRIYKALVPFYKKDEIDSEIHNEWIFDCGGRSDLDYSLLSHALFRVAHWWSVHIDYEEYAFLLRKIYDRVTCKVIIKAQTRDRVLPKIVVSFPEEEKQLKNSNEEDKPLDDDEAEGEEEGWLECDEDESPRSDFEYKYGDDNDAMDLKRYKRPKRGAGSNLLAVTHIKEPFLYREEVEYDFDNLEEGAAVIDQLMGDEYVLPLGYPTEQFLFKVKNDVHEVLSAHKENNKANDDDIEDFIDPGDVKISHETLDQTFQLFTNNGFHKEYSFIARIYDVLYNKIRYAFRECVQMSVRLFPEYPNVNLRSSSAASRTDGIPLTEISKIGYNPCLDRRIEWELHNLPKKKATLFVNQMYMVDHMDLKYAFKTKLNQIEDKSHLITKEEDGIRREEDFIPAQSNYSQVIQIMLNKKFENVYINRAKIEEQERQRLKKMKDREAKKAKESGITPVDNSAQEKIQLEQKTIKTSFHHLMSKEGVIEDPCVSTNDLITLANQPATSILVLGKPRSGKTKVCANLAEALDIVHISVQNYTTRLLKKIADYEPPEDLEEGEEPPKFLTDLEDQVHQELKAGRGPNDEMITGMLAETIVSPEAQTKGFVIDLPFYNRPETWFETMERGSLNIMPQDISFIVELDMSDNDIKIRANGIRFDPETGEVVSRWERDERRKPKKKKRDEDAEGEEDEDEEEEEDIDPDDPDAPRKPKILQEDQVLMQIRDLDDQINEELNVYANIRPSFDNLIKGLYHHQYIKIDSAGLTPEVIRDTLVARIKGENTLLRPLAVPLEAEGDAKSYLTSGKEEGELPRRWSLWKQTDPVALFNGKVVEGVPDFAASFNDKVFLFETEENLKEFCSQPKKYLQAPPQMPDRFRLLIAGPSGAGSKTVAKQLSEKYRWKIADWNEIVAEKERWMRSMGEEIKPNNPLEENYGLGLSEEDWNLVCEGKPIDSFNLLPWFYEHLNLECEKRRPPPPPPEGEGEGELDEEAKAALEIEKKKKAEEKKKAEAKKKKALDKKKKEKAKKVAEGEGEPEEEEEEEEPLEDLPIAEIDLKIINEETKEKPFVGGFIMLGFPQTAEHIEKLKANDIGFDKIIFMQDTDEENPGQVLKDRKADDDLYDLAFEQENSERLLGIYKEQYDELVNEISCNGTVDEVLARVYAAIDPFFTQVDNPENVRTAEDIDEEGKPLPKGEYGDFCPVTLVND